VGGPGVWRVGTPRFCDARPHIQTLKAREVRGGTDHGQVVYGAWCHVIIHKQIRRETARGEGSVKSASDVAVTRAVGDCLN
jgi:hypothetical protein